MLTRGKWFVVINIYCKKAPSPQECVWLLRLFTPIFVCVLLLFTPRFVCVVCLFAPGVCVLCLFTSGVVYVSYYCLPPVLYMYVYYVWLCMYIMFLYSLHVYVCYLFTTWICMCNTLVYPLNIFALPLNVYSLRVLSIHTQRSKNHPIWFIDLFQVPSPFLTTKQTVSLIKCEWFVNWYNIPTVLDNVC
jgi:hypothetical protein